MKKYIEQSTMVAMEVISQDLALNIQEMYENYISQGFGPAEIEDDFEMRYKMTHDGHDFRNLSEAQKREAFSQYWGHYWYTSKKWDMKLMSELGIKANTKRFNIQDKAKHGQSKWHHNDRMYLAGNDIHGTFKTRKQKEAMDQREKDIPDKCYSSQELNMVSIKKLYMQVQNRMTKSIQEITLEILDMVAHYELTAEIMDSIEEEVNTLFHDEVNYMYYLKWEIEEEETAIRRLELQLRAKRDIVAKTKQELWEIQNT